MKDEHTYGKKIAKKGRTKVTYKGTFVCIQTLTHSTAPVLLTKDSRNEISYDFQPPYLEF